MHPTLARPATPRERALAAGTGPISARFLNPQTISTLVLLVWWVFQMASAVAHPDPVGTDLPAKQAVAADAANSVEAGGLQNTLLVCAFGALGAWHLARSRRSLDREAVRPLLGLLGLYLVWAAASVLWSVDLMLTVRRLVQFLLLSVGSIGLGLGLYGASENGRRLLAKHLLAAGIIATAALWFSVASAGGANILDPAYSTKNLGLWTTAAHPIAYSVFAAVYLWHEGRMRGWQFATFVVVWAVSLFIEKVRFITGYSIGLLIVLLFRHVSAKRLAIGALPLAFILSVGLAGFAAFGTAAIDPLLNTAFAYATVDQGSDNITGLSGRSDLWDLLQTYSAARPELGYGFGAFWNPDHLQQIASALSWAPTVAHNGYIDELLATGVVGLIVNVTFWLAALSVALWRAVRTRDEFAWLAAACVMFFLLLNWGDSIMQFYFRYPFYVSLAALFALLGSGGGLSRVASSARSQNGRRSLAAE